MNNPYGNLNQPSSPPRAQRPEPGYGQPGYVDPHAQVGQPQPGYGQPQAGYGQPQAGYGQPQPGYGQPQAGYGQPQQQPGGYVSYGQGAAPAQGYGPAPGYQPNELSKLEDDAQLWLLVAAAGFWVGFGWITGPLGWYFGSQIRGKYRALGHHPCSSANWAYGIGIASTLLYYVFAALIALIIVVAVGAAI